MKQPVCDQRRYKGKPFDVHWLDGIGDYALYGPLAHKVPGTAWGTHDNNWAGGTTDDALAFISGAKAPRELKLVNDVLAKVDSAFREREAHSWEPSPVGAYPVVPEALLGLPECMRLKQAVESDNAPIRIYVSQFVSGSYTPEQIARRGAAVAALAMRLAETRPVELVAVIEQTGKGKHSGRNTAIACPVPVQGMSAALVTAALATPAVMRRLVFAMATYVDDEHNSGHPVFDVGEPGVAQAKEAFGLSDADVYVPMLCLGDEFADPVAWVNKMLAKQRDVYHEGE